ncbi:putative ABC1 family protein, mitochondrial precursor [Suhomyces tanzawaensis NRRL Y-17324]|uniref:Putative ABC1 family protein, mitochondrial n=1 Tax=Suhomyces tanzawaensis NRRL Y-17324 TaxID=984487 RepID=A0A1E4SM56_9ASCO|nr:putative ABC1 family protein, mitochondrial precursor [Suhomyces tanzawaensis NRRL Y-17324]ODV80609.1 putative ABC1 family protein, mitochondrial precursor [Suhomyces tanzawaensis NRRL Y-17324]
MGFRTQSYHPIRHSPVVKVVAAGLVGTVSGSLLYSHTIWNDVHAIDTSVHELEPVKDSETYENGLYLASQKEEQDQYDHYRQTKTGQGLLLKRIFYYLKFHIDDYIINPLVTFARFLELSAIFVPVLLTSPLCWFGKKNRKTGTTVRSGARLWFRYLRWSAELAGASFIKLGQWAASRTDIFPKEMCEELGTLHSNAKAHSLHETKRIISQSFGDLPFDEIFDEFNDKPLGVGAIAQVYIAKLSNKAIERVKDLEKEDSKRKVSLTQSQQFLDSILVTEHGDTLTNNQHVAIKVLHPNVEVKINRDLRIIKFFANVIDVIPTMEWLSLPDEVEQFSVLMRLQLDLRIEGLNLAKFRDNFKSRLDIHFPKPYLNFTTRNVLVEEFIHAIPMSRLLSLEGNFGKNLSKEVSDKGLDAFLKMLILDNFVHADLHPGNMMVRFYKNELFPHEKEYKIVKSSNESETNKITNELLKLGDDKEAWCQRLESLYQEGYHAEICFLDVGLITELNHEDRVNFIDLFKALSEFDGYKAGELMVERSRTPETAINKEIFALKVEKLVDRVKERTFALGNISIGDLLDQVLGMVRSHHVRMEGDFITVIVAILLLEGIGRRLDPDLDLFASSLPVLRKLGVLKEGRDILRNENSLSMIKVWLVLEVRQFINASIQDIHALVKADMLSPNI